MKQMFLTLFLLATLTTGALAAAKKGTWTGWVSDAKCGAKVDAACAKKCADGGEARVFIEDSDKSVLTVSNQDVLKGHEGHHVNVKGSVDNSTPTVSSVSMIADQNTK
jgi:hypothetical protein